MSINRDLIILVKVVGGRVDKGRPPMSSYRKATQNMLSHPFVIYQLG